MKKNNTLIRKCSKCGREYDIRLTDGDLLKFREGTPLKELFEEVSPIIKEQVCRDLCDTCYAEYRKKVFS